MASTISKDNLDDTAAPGEERGVRARLEGLNNPGMWVGSALGAASTLLSGDPLLVTAVSSTVVAGGWAALGMRPGPWRFLPGHGEPYAWMDRAGRRRWRRRVTRMRRRLNTVSPQTFGVGSQGLLVPAEKVAEGWRERGDRPALVREATAAAHRKRVAILTALWRRALPDWKRGWWRRYSATEMALRAGPLAALPATGYLSLPWWADLTVAAIASGWGALALGKPAPAAAPGPCERTGRDEDWYLTRWQEWIAHERGPLPGSRLVSVRLDDDKLVAVIVSTTSRPALSVGQEVVSIAFDVPPRAVNVYRPDDLPASRAKLTVKLRAQESAELDENDLAAVWEEYSPYPGSTLYAAERTEYGRSFKLLMPRKGASVADVQPRQVAQALDLEGEDAVARLHLRMLDSRRLEVNELTVNPLQNGVPLDLDALVMDEQGYVRVALDVYGRQSRWRLMIPNEGRFGISGRQGMSAVHSFASGTTGSGKSSLEETLLIAQQVNGIVSWLADGKYGAGFASWTKVVDWLVKSHLGAMLMARGAADVGKHRFSTQMRMQWRDGEGYLMDGRSFFVPGEPFAPMQVTFDEFNEMVLDTTKDHVKPLLENTSNLGRQTRSAGIGARVYVQIPNLDSIGTDKHANAIRDMLQSGNIALFRTARAEVNIMSLGSRTPEFRLGAIPEKFPNGSGTAGLGYIADGGAQYTQSRMMFHPNPVRIAQSLNRPTLSDEEAEAAGPAYLHRDAYRHMDAAEEEEFLRDLLAREQSTHRKNTTVVPLTSVVPAGDGDGEDEDLDALVPPSRSQIVWNAVDQGARRNKQIAAATQLQPSNVAGATKRLERLGKLRQENKDWHTDQPLDATPA
ncbi:hypothetical protein [Streptomyces sp. NPDC001054]